ncbi:MAG: glycosyltransferase [Mangrovicoccus sp.]|nr:glycosyltransferase [Mangrovicoccus sp.]
MSDQPRLAVIIPHYNDLARLQKCLTALAPQLGAHPQVEAVVADNNSPCDLAPLKAAHPSIRFVTEPRKGAAAARNCGVRETTAPDLAFLDSDCVPGPDWLASALRLSGGRAAGQGGDVIGGRIDTFDETPPPRSGAEAFEAVFAFHQRDYVERKGFSVTANLLTSRAVFEDVGDLIVGLSEDMDWCFRATAKGYGLAYADDLCVAHPTRSDWPALQRKWRRTTDEGFHLHGTSPKARLSWAMRALVVAASAFAHIPKILKAPQLDGWGEKRRGIGTLFRLRFQRVLWMLAQAATGR